MNGPTLRQLVAVNTAALLCAILCGAVVSAAGRQQVRLDAAGGAVPASVTTSVHRIVEQNGRVWLSICGGVVSLGVVGLVVVVTNGFRFGMDAAAVARSVPHELRFLLPHSVLEFAAFTLAAAACQQLGWQLFELLAWGRRARHVGSSGAMLVASACLGLAAAIVEALSEVARAA